MVSLKKWGMIAGFMGLVQSVLWVAISFSFLIIHDLEINYNPSNYSLPLTFYESFIKKDEEGPNLVSLFMIIYLLLSLFWFAASIYLLKTVKLEQEEPMVLANTKRYSHLIWSVLTFLVCVLDIAFTISITTGFIKIPYQRIVFNGKLVEVTTNRAKCQTDKLDKMDKADLFWVSLSKREAPNYNFIQDDLKESRFDDHIDVGYKPNKTIDDKSDESDVILDHEISESKISGYLKQFINPEKNKTIEDVMINDSFVTGMRTTELKREEPAFPDLDEIVYRVNDHLLSPTNNLELPSDKTENDERMKTLPLGTNKIENDTGLIGKSSTILSLYNFKQLADKKNILNRKMKETNNSIDNVGLKTDKKLLFNRSEGGKTVDVLKNDSNKFIDIFATTVKDNRLNKISTTKLKQIEKKTINLKALKKTSFTKENDKTESTANHHLLSSVNTDPKRLIKGIDELKKSTRSILNVTILYGITKQRNHSDLVPGIHGQTVSDADAETDTGETTIKHKFYNEYEDDDINDSSNETRDYYFDGKTFENFLEENSIPSNLVNEMKKINKVIHENLPHALYSQNGVPALSNWKDSPELKAHLENIQSLERSIHDLDTPNVPAWYTRRPNEEKHSFKQLPKLPSFGPTKVVVTPTKMIRNSSILIMLLLASRLGVLLLLNFMLCLVAFYLSMRYAQMYKEEKEQVGNRVQRNLRRPNSRPNLFSDFNESSTVSFDRPRTPRLNKNIAFVIPIHKD